MAGGLKTIAVALISMLFGRWDAGILLRDRLVRDYVKRLPQNALASEYIFDVESRVRRPLWTYTVEDRGSRVIMVIYSVNDLFFTAEEGPKLDYNAYTKIMSWSHYVGLSRDQASLYTQKTAVRARLDLVGCVDRGDDGTLVPLITAPNRILVFDVAPYHFVRFAEYGSIFSYFYGPNVCQFLEDILTIASETGAVVILKGKKDRGRVEEKNYRRLKRRFSESGTLSFLSPTLAASRAVAIADIVISLPFTSTAIIANTAGTPSIYYDPTGKLAMNRPEMHGVAVIGGRAALRSWITSSLRNLGKGAGAGAALKGVTCDDRVAKKR